MNNARQIILDFLHSNAITQTDLADVIGVKKQYLNLYLTGQIDSIDTELACLDFIDAYTHD